MNDLGTTNRLLLIIVIPLIFYLLKELSFIFVPLFFSMFIALLFLPLMRWLKKKNVPNALSVVAVLGIIASMLYLSGRLIRLSTSELLSVNSSFVALAEIKLLGLVVSIESFIGIE
ncbi:MAG: AI-2E family transporter, partial [Flavobacteriales bacterium]